MSKFPGKYASLAFVAAALVFVGCHGGEYKSDAQGAPYELVVVADRAEWDGPVGDTLRSMFYRRLPVINRQEPLFDVLRVLPSGFKTLITRHRNILMIGVGEQYATASLGLSRDTYSQSQIIITAQAPDESSMLKLIDDNRDDIMLLLESAERDRDVAEATAHTPVSIAGLIREKFGFEMSMGPGFRVRSEGDDFLWISFELPTSSQGIVIYTYPFSGLKDFDKENLFARRNEFVSRIPGENPGSHMSSNPEMAEVIYQKIHDRQWAELRGFWDVKGDFMGGPYRNFSTLDAANQRVVAVDFYVFSPDPRFSQRNYIHQLEHYLYTVKIPNTPFLQ